MHVFLKLATETLVGFITNKAYTLSMKKEPILYIKDGCPWCAEAMAFFDKHGIPLDIREVHENPDYMKELIAVSEQSSTPTFVYDDFIVADFSVNEFLDELEQMPEVRIQLGIPDNASDD